MGSISNPPTIDVPEAFYSEVDDLSDLTQTKQDWVVIVNTSRATFLTIATAVNLLGGFFYSNNGTVVMEMTVDGGAMQTLVPTSYKDSTDTHHFYRTKIPPVKCDSSLLLEAYNPIAAPYDWAAEVWTK